jgi:hypothetical protein
VAVDDMAELGGADELAVRERRTDTVG